MRKRREIARHRPFGMMRPPWTIRAWLRKGSESIHKGSVSGRA
ncbi:hypothetical protein SAVIM338S_05718 [Streptomyces avidinii]